MKTKKKKNLLKTIKESLNKRKGWNTQHRTDDSPPQINIHV